MPRVISAIEAVKAAQAPANQLVKTAKRKKRRSLPLAAGLAAGLGGAAAAGFGGAAAGGPVA